MSDGFLSVAKDIAMAEYEDARTVAEASDWMEKAMFALLLPALAVLAAVVVVARILVAAAIFGVMGISSLAQGREEP